MTIELGGFVSIVGANGCGKSTLIRIINNLETPTEGEVLIDGKLVKNPLVETGLFFRNHICFHG